MSKYPINLIEADFVQKRMTFEEITARYGIKTSTLTYHSGKLDWHKKRKEFKEKVKSKLTTEQVKQEVKEQYNVISELEKLRNLKIKAEMQVFLNTGKCRSKEIMHLINKSKDPVGELTKIIELLKGNATGRVEVNEQEKQLRYNRLKDHMMAS